jgi:hypothetical protein
MNSINIIRALVVLTFSTTIITAQQITGSSIFSPTLGGARILSAQGNTPENPAIGFQSAVSTVATAQNDGGGGNGIFRPSANTMAFSTASTERMRINSSGNIGIGLLNPTAKLDVLSEIKVTSSSDNSRTYRITSGNRQEIFATNDLLTFSGQNNGIILNNNNNNPGSFFVKNSSLNNLNLFTINGINGKTGVGTTSFPTTIGGANISAYRLFVRGGILTEEVRVRTGWADYVFADDYQLKSISEVETFIKENKHMPNVPSAAQVEEEGISLGEMAKIQQEKIEELMLYIIQQEKRIKALEVKLIEK